MEQIPLKQNMGYNPTIFLGDFTGNHIEDILVVSDTGGSGGIVNGEIFPPSTIKFVPSLMQSLLIINLNIRSIM